MNSKAVYLITCTTETAGVLSKIGGSKSPFNRLDSIKTYYIKNRNDASTAQILAFGYPDSAASVEGELHKQYSQYRFSDPAVVKGREWFALPLNEINRIVDLLRSFPSLPLDDHERAMAYIQRRMKESPTFIPLYPDCKLTREQIKRVFGV